MLASQKAQTHEYWQAQNTTTIMGARCFHNVNAIRLHTHMAIVASKVLHHVVTCGNACPDLADTNDMMAEK